MARDIQSSNIGNPNVTNSNWSSIIQKPSLITGNPFVPLENGTPADEKDIYYAFNVLAREFHSPIDRQTLFINGLLFIVAFLGNFAGAEYAQNFAETFSEEVFSSDSGAGFEFFSYYIPTVYMIANICISMISLGKTIDEVRKFTKSNPLYAEWMDHNKYYLGLEKAEQLVSALFAGFACFALIAQNKDPDATTSAAAYYFALICQYTGVGASVALFTRSFTTLFEKYCTDLNALITGNIEDREKLHAAKIYILQKLAEIPSGSLHVSIPMIAQGYNNTLTPFIDPIATAASVWLLYPYIAVNYGDAAKAATSNDTALTMSNFATYGVLALCAKATAGIATSITDKVHSMVTHTPKIHHSSDSSLLGLFTKLITVAAPSMAAAAGRFAEFSDNPLETREQVIEAVLNAMRAVGINWADVDRVSSLLYKKAARSHNIKFGDSLEEFLSNVMKVASGDGFIRKLFKPVANPNAACGETPRSSQLTTRRTAGTGNDSDAFLLDAPNTPIITINSQGYPAASIFGQGIRLVRACGLFQANNAPKNFEVKDTQLFNAIGLLETGKDQYDLDQLYKNWLKKPLAKPESIEFADVPLLGYQSLV